MFRNQPWNLKEMTFREHMAIHFLFGLRTPIEIFDLLTSGSYQMDAFDDRQWKHWRTLFGSKGNFEAAGVVLDWIQEGAPDSL